MKHQTFILAVTLLTAGALATSCDNEDNIADEPMTQQPATNEMTFTATVAPKSSATTRSVDADGHTAWVENEQIAVYYQKSDDTYGKATATVGTPNGDGSAPITATLSSAKDGCEVKFVYPASLANDTGDDINETRLLTAQKGILTYGGKGTDYSISKNFDAATATATLSTDGTTCGTTTTIGFTNRVCICKFSFSTSGIGTISAMEKLEIHIDGKTYSISPSAYNSSKTVYVAMLPTSGADALFGVYNNGAENTTTGVTLYGENYVKVASNVTLTAGKFYTSIPIECITAQEYSGNPTSTITIPANGAIILNNATVSVAEGSGSGDGIKTTDSANGIIVLKGTNSVSTSVKGSAGIFVPSGGTTLVIGGNGSLTATAGPAGG